MSQSIAPCRRRSRCRSHGLDATPATGVAFTHVFALLILCLASVSIASAAGAAGAAEAVAPNVLIIMADDCTYNDLPLYGGQNARTPHIDKLATQGLVFNQAYLTSAMCQPCRAELYTGQYPMRNGCAWNHSASLPTTTSMPHHLGALGYRVGIAGKVHVKPAKAFPFTDVSGFDKNCVRNPTQKHDLAAIKRFMQGPQRAAGNLKLPIKKPGRQTAQPFCLVIALVEPHVPWVMGDASKYPPKKIKLPPNIADTPRTREDFGKYLAEITYMDQQVGDILRVLEETGKANDTLVLFTSEQGSQFPGCKWTNWNTGVHTALIARWPGKVPAGKRTDAVVQYADVLPTLLHAATPQVNDPADSPVRPAPKLPGPPLKPIGGYAHKFDGTSFLPVLLGQSQAHRRYAYGMHNNIPEGPAYPLRSITNGRFRYIRNLRPEELYIEKHLMGLKGKAVLNNPYWATWLRESAESPRTYSLVKRYMRRPAEQLYDTLADPYELTDLAADKAHQAIKAELSGELDRWMKEQGDPGAEQDTQASIQAARQGEHRFRPAE